jgi:PX domain
MSSSSHHSRAIKVSCFKYEDSKDEFGQVVVMYVILVEDVTKNVKHILHKRYSDFLELFTVLKDLSPDIENFRFPNKSLFNNRAQFTLERRLEGFNDFLQLAIKLKPMPEEVAQFLGLYALLRDSEEATFIKNRRRRSSEIDRSRNYDSGHVAEIANSSKDNGDVSYLSQRTNSYQEKNQYRHQYQSSYAPLNDNGSINNGAYARQNYENYAEENVKKNMHIIGSFSLLTAVIIYITCVLFGTIDISRTTKGIKCLHFTLHSEYY